MLGSRTARAHDTVGARHGARTYFHGSDREFEPGDIIRPQKETGVPNWAEQLGHPGALGPHYTGEHVYHADSVGEAMNFGRHVYEVKPSTRAQRDPEDEGGRSGWFRNQGPAEVVRRVTR